MLWQGHLGRDRVRAGCQCHWNTAVGFWTPGVENCRNKARMSMKTKEERQGSGRFAGSGEFRQRQSVRSISTRTLCHCMPGLVCLLPTAYLPIRRAADVPTCRSCPPADLPTCLLPPERAVQKRHRAGPGVCSGGLTVPRLVVRVLKGVAGAIVLLHID